MKKADRPNRPAGPRVGVVMGSTSDWETMKHADEMLTRFGVAHECRVMSAHRSPKLTAEWAATAEKRGLAVIIAAAGGAAHLAGVLASHTVLPVLGVPMESVSLKGLDSLLSTVQLPAGIWTVERSESRPFKETLSIGTPRTGRTVCEARTPARCAAPPAAAMITARPRFSAVAAHSAVSFGLR